MGKTGAATGGGASLAAEESRPPRDVAAVPESGVPSRRFDRRRLERAALYAAALVAVITPVAAALDVSFPGRMLLALAFVVAVPGVPLASLLRVPSALVTTALAVALSISAALLTATVAVFTGWWSPLGWATAIAAVGLAVTVPALRRLRRSATDDQGTAESTAPVQDTAGPRSRSDVWNRPVFLVVLAAALGFWWLATRWVDLDAAGATGLIGVLNWPYVVAVVLVAVTAGTQLLRSRLDPVLLSAAALTLALIIFGFANIADAHPGVPTGWLHAGFADFIDENQRSFTGLDARASWPALFAAAAQLVTLGGAADATVLLALAPFFYNAAAIPALLVIARAVTRSERLAWLSVFLYLGMNWVQQDYFSPQATAFLLYLTVLATLLWESTTAAVEPLTGSRWSRTPQAWRRRPGLPAGTTSGQSLAREGALLVIGGAIVLSHQLTPVTLVITLVTFAITGWTRHRRLWLLISLFFVAWFSYGAHDFWAGHLDDVLGETGRLFANIDSAVTSRVVGDPTYQLMQNVRVGWSLLFAVLAAVGLWTIRRRPDAVLVALLAVGAGGLILLQSYGGEVAFRTFLFVSPILAPLAAVALRALTTGRSLVRTTLLAAVLALVAVMGTTTRGVNVAFERVPDGELTAARFLWERIDAGDRVGFFTPAGPYGADRFGDWDMLLLDEETCGLPALECAVDRVPEFLVLDRTQSAELELVSGERSGAARAVTDELVRRGLYTEIFEGPDATILEFDEEGA
jgi:hypothetical protein